MITNVFIGIILISKVYTEKFTFPKYFKFGVATSAPQIEGAWQTDGKGVHIWDKVTQINPSYIQDRSNANVACDSYHKWEEDVMLIKNLNAQIYRFSLSWTRLFPDGYTTKLNQPGVNYYNKLINKLLENGIEPVVTLYHWDLPQIFAPLGGWSNPALISLFARFSKAAFTLFGDRVKTWITFNEPRLICHNWKGLTGDVDSLYPLGVIEYLCDHNILKAHAEAYIIYDKLFRSKQRGRISIGLDAIWTDVKNSSNLADLAAAEQWRQFEIGIYAHPIFKFGYPQAVIDRVAERSRAEGFEESRLPKFTTAEKNRIKGTYDFLGINYYVTYHVKATEEPPVGSPNIDIDAGGGRYFDPSWKSTGTPWIKETPWGFYNLLKWIKESYGNPEIILMEIGVGDNGTLQDTDRIRFYQGILNSTLCAISNDKVNVTSLLAWSLLDNFEWTHGYLLKFGLYHVDFSNPKRTRTPKKSLKFFQNLFATRSLE